MTGFLACSLELADGYIKEGEEFISSASDALICGEDLNSLSVPLFAEGGLQWAITQQLKEKSAAAGAACLVPEGQAIANAMRLVLSSLRAVVWGSLASERDKSATELKVEQLTQMLMDPSFKPTEA